MSELQRQPSDCRVIAAVNQKGGVGKTNLSTNMSIGLAQRGYKVLIVDLDSQASQTVSLGWTQPDELPVNIATILSKVMESQSNRRSEPIDPHDGILHHHEGVDLMPSGIELSGLELRMINAYRRESLLKSYVSMVRPDYDYIVLDCPPTLGVMTVNALAAADGIIVPVQPEFLSVVGMTQLFDTVAMVKEEINPTLKVEGVLFTLANMRTNLAKNTAEIVKEAYGDNIRIFPTPIPYSTKVKEASAAGKSIFAYEPNGKAAYAYEKLVEEVERGGKQRGTNIQPTKKIEPCR
ncbi:ParA family protein [Eubacteriales bacterium OttesenSCG-928-G02]|nr:ParA family protein [Eubacteriales bacterium OttesenSCG-928-G02]